MDGENGIFVPGKGGQYPSCQPTLCGLSAADTKLAGCTTILVLLCQFSEPLAFSHTVIYKVFTSQRPSFVFKEGSAAQSRGVSPGQRRCGSWDPHCGSWLLYEPGFTHTT